MTDLTVSRTVAATPGVTWDLWTTPEGLSQWWWPARFGTTYEITPRVGERYRFETAETPPFGVLGLSGAFESVRDHESVTYTWQWDSDQGRISQVTVTLETAPGHGTKITIAHRGLADEEDASNHVQGWNDCLDRLEAHCAGSSKSGTP